MEPAPPSVSEYKLRGSAGLVFRNQSPSSIQVGIVKGDTIFAALKKVARAMGYQGVRLHKPDLPQESDPPEVEHKRMFAGEVVKPSLFENTNEHLVSHTRMLVDPIVETWPESAREHLAQHVVETQQMQMMVNMLRQMQATNAAQMQARMGEMGVRPGMAGGQQEGDQAGGGTEGEGVQGPEAPTQGGMPQ